jgi:osmoprotectant transport system permease protein
MLTETAQTPRRNGLWRDMLEGWVVALTEPSVDTFRAQKARADPLKIVLGVGLLGLVIGLLALVTQPPALVESTENELVNLLRIIFFAEADFLIISLVLFLIARAFGGVGSFVEHSYLLSLIAAPLGIIVVAFLYVGEGLGLTLTAVLDPLSPLGIVGVLIVLFALYGLMSLFFALTAAHELRSSDTLYTVGVVVVGWGALRVASMFAAGEENIITTEWDFIADQWSKGNIQHLLLGHLWLIAFSVAIAVVVGVIIGVFITWPRRRPQRSHLVILIPLVIFFLVWAASSGLFGDGLADAIKDVTRDLDRALSRVGGFFGPLLDIVGAIVSKPAAVGMIGLLFTIILYLLYLAGDTASTLTLYVAGIILTIPSVALFGVFISPLGIGPFNAAFALILYAQLPILRNTYAGIRAVPPEVIEAGRGMGMTEMELLRKVKLPMAVPVIMTGVRVSIVMLIGIASIAAYIGNDTLGEYIFAGIQRAQEKWYIAGAVLIAILALVVDYFLGRIQDRLTPTGLKGRREV